MYFIVETRLLTQFTGGEYSLFLIVAPCFVSADSAPQGLFVMPVMALAHPFACNTALSTQDQCSV